MRGITCVVVLIACVAASFTIDERYFFRFQCQKARICSPKNPLENLSPRPRLDGGVYFPFSYVRNFCRLSQEYIDCVSVPEITGNRYCSRYVRRMRTVSTLQGIVCSNESIADLYMIRSCANDLDMQRDLQRIILRTKGRFDVLNSLPGDQTKTMICRGISYIIRDFSSKVEYNCRPQVPDALRNMTRKLLPFFIEERIVPNCTNLYSF